MLNFNLKPVLTKKEKVVILFCSFLIILLIAFPYFYGALTTPKEKIFTWATFRQSLDYNAYHSWAIQYSQGKIMAKILYTTENHPALFFHPVFFLAGQINRFLKIPLEIIFIIFSLLANFFLLLTLYYFISHFLDSFFSRFISFIFISLGSGLGWLVGQSSADLSLFEITLFNILSWPFIMSLGLTLLLWSLLFFIKSFEEEKFKKTIFAGFFAFLLAAIHPYEIVIFYALASVYLFFFTKFWLKMKKFFIVFLFPLPMVVYQFWVNHSHFVWHEHSLTPMISPPLSAYLLGLFPFILFALFSLKNILEEKRMQILFLWSLTYFFLFYLPLTFQWKLSLGISIPLGILAGLGLDNLYQSLNKKLPKISPGLPFCLAILFFSSLTNVVIFDLNLRTFQKKDYPYYLSQEIKEGFDWLKNNTFEDEAVFSSYEMGNFIPRYSGNKVFIGHWAQTISLQEKKQLVENFFAGKIDSEKMKKFFKDHQLKYIFYSDFEKKIGSVELEKFGQIVFKNSQVNILKIDL